MTQLPTSFRLKPLLELTTTYTDPILRRLDAGKGIASCVRVTLRDRKHEGSCAGRGSRPGDE